MATKGYCFNFHVSNSVLLELVLQLIKKHRFICFSAVHVLEEDGQILVTLCKGQGGTPADRPMRAWHDSWQVVSMAANSSLILVETKPFQIEDYETYTSTGFRCCLFFSLHHAYTPM